MIPPFNHNGVLPPYSGVNPALAGALSPYTSNIEEFCRHFALNPERIEILKGFVNFRLKCQSYGINGFQWIDGSFVEDVETRENRTPNDIDVVTFVDYIDSSKLKSIISSFYAFVSSKESKKDYRVDHYIVEAAKNPIITIKGVTYWNQLFGHNRSGVWKGMIQIPIGPNPTEDKNALNFLNSL